MNSLRMSFTKTILVLCIILYSSNQAFSLKCYKCLSKFDEDCYKNPKNTAYEVTCFGGTRFAVTSPHIDNSSLLSAVNVSSAKGSEVSYASSSYDCFKITATQKGFHTVERDCIFKSWSDEFIKEEARKLGINVESLHRCDSDLCNSSSPLSIGFLSLISSFILIFLAKL